MQLGCKQPMANPETVDPIYSDLIAQMNAAKSEIATEEKALE